MGGKKKASKPPLKKESKYKIPAMFGCPLCDAKSAITIKIARKAEQASVRCRECGATKLGIRCNYLEKNCDVYFKFRDLVQAEDRKYLRQHGIQAQAAQAGVSGLQLIEEIDVNRFAASAADVNQSVSGGAGVATARTIAAPQRHTYDDNGFQDELADPGHHFAAEAEEVEHENFMDL